jgi:hypothetical protein
VIASHQPLVRRTLNTGDVRCPTPFGQSRSAFANRRRHFLLSNCVFIPQNTLKPVLLVVQRNCEKTQNTRFLPTAIIGSTITLIIQLPNSLSPATDLICSRTMLRSDTWQYLHLIAVSSILKGHPPVELKAK